MHRPLIQIAALLVPTLASAQPFSQSMSDCASLHQNLAQWVDSEEMSDLMMFGAGQWHAAAVAQSAREGDPVTDDAMWDIIDDKTTAWEAKGKSFFITQEFHDWTDYCRSFADNQGIRTKP